MVASKCPKRLFLSILFGIDSLRLFSTYNTVAYEGQTSYPATTSVILLIYYISDPLLVYNELQFGRCQRRDSFVLVLQVSFVARVIRHEPSERSLRTVTTPYTNERARSRVHQADTNASTAGVVHWAFYIHFYVHEYSNIQIISLRLE